MIQLQHAGTVIAAIVAAVQSQCVLSVPHTDLWLLDLAAGPGMRERERDDRLLLVILTWR